MIIEKADPEDQETFARLMDLSVEMAEEMALVPVNPEKAAGKVYDTIRNGLCWVAKSNDRIVGAIGLKEIDFDYADGTFWADSFFYVDRAERFGAIGVKLIRAVRDAAKEAEKICIVARVREDQREKRSEFGIYAEIAGFTPFGHMARIA
ncbi:GNAT family N-acetyltransferase [Bauldia litoralis]|uniref:GNAT family N-acetyltransferase n=1 Tax=Bauldia litoralis TaxID=665467 RepID=UPI003263DD31